MIPHDFYPFESPQATGLVLIPLRVRYKLDCVGLRLRLTQWQALTAEEKGQLLRLPVDTATEQGDYRDALRRMVARVGEDIIADPLAADQKVWRDLSRWPALVTGQCEAQGVVMPPLAAWQALDEPARHALFVLARSHHSQKEFVAAIDLFCSGRRQASI